MARTKKVFHVIPTIVSACFWSWPVFMHRNAQHRMCLLQDVREASKRAREDAEGDESGSNADTDAVVIVISNAVSVRRHVKVGSFHGS